MGMFDNSSQKTARKRVRDFRGSFQTQLAFIAFFSFSSPLLAAPLAVPLKDAEAGLSKAYNQYYDEIKAKGRPVTSQEAAALQEKTIAPAQKELDQSLIESTRQSLKEVKPLVRAPLVIPPIPKGLKSAHRASPLPETESQRPIPAAASTPEPEPARSETVLDGSNVPREIEFPGPKPTSQPVAPPVKTLRRK
jgi:hypothetical protein